VSWNETSATRFGAALRQLRQERGLSQESLAFRAGVTKNQVQLIEAGHGSGRKESPGPSNPRISTLAGLAEVLGMSVGELLTEAEI
jgi:transcriptional regulator with XRE-family HTH domain